MKQHKIYITLTAVFLLSCAAVLNFLPRSTVSALEKRDLRSFPAFSWQSLFDGSFANDISLWYSDSEPFRDELMTVSMMVGKYQGLALINEQDHISFVANNEPDLTAVDDTDSLAVDDDSDTIVNIDELTRIGHSGIIVLGQPDTVRALMCYGGVGGGSAYANAANTYQSTFGSAVRVYCMVIPTATEFYIPEKVRNRSKSQLSTILSVESKLTGGVKSVNIHNALASHKNEDIYLRTDHHWAPLGAYYAAKEFARVAGVPFLDISTYDRHVVHGYVGSMYGYSGDISVKQSPEDFVYWTPRNVSYSTSYITYTLDKEYHIVAESKPHSGQFFYKHKDGSGQAYCTFMGSDSKITNVKTSTHNGRRLLILKDSFGNALPGWLFGSFEEINVVDCRYFTKNMVKFVQERGITDILFANNVFKAYSPYVGKNYVRFLSQAGGLPNHLSTADSTAAKQTVPADNDRPSPSSDGQNGIGTSADSPLLPETDETDIDQF